MKLSVHYLIGPSLKRVKDETAGKETLSKAKKAKTSSIAYFFRLLLEILTTLCFVLGNDHKSSKKEERPSKSPKIQYKKEKRERSPEKKNESSKGKRELREPSVTEKGIWKF